MTTLISLRLGRLRWRRYGTRQRRRCQTHKRSSEKLPFGIEVPGEQRRAGATAEGASVAQRIAHDKLQSLRPHLRVGPAPSITIAGIDRNFRKQAFQVLVLEALLHALLVELLQVLSVHEPGVAVDQKQSEVAWLVEGIHHPGDIDPSNVAKARHDCELAMVLFVELAGEIYRRSGSSCFRHLRHEAIGILTAVGRIAAN